MINPTGADHQETEDALEQYGLHHRGNEGKTE